MLTPPLHYFSSVSDHWFGEGGEALVQIHCGNSAARCRNGAGAHAQYVITNETTRCLTKQDSLLSDNFGQKVDGSLRVLIVLIL